jgi:hypothetical protein
MTWEYNWLSEIWELLIHFKTAEASRNIGRKCVKSIKSDHLVNTETHGKCSPVLEKRS